MREKELAKLLRQLPELAPGNYVFRLRFTRVSGHSAQAVYTRAPSLEAAIKKGYTIAKERLHPAHFQDMVIEGDIRFYQAEGPIPPGDVPQRVTWI